MLRSKALASLLQDEGIDTTAYNTLILDTQGSEPLVLKGAVPILRKFTYVNIESPDYESCTGCSQLADIELFLARYGYREIIRDKFAEHSDGGCYYDIVYKQQS